jgi:hypothetical protein
MIITPIAEKNLYKYLYELDSRDGDEAETASGWDRAVVWMFSKRHSLPSRTGHPL